MAKRTDRYVVRYEHDDSGMWVATIPDVDGCMTQGRTIAQARERIREALALCLDDDERAAHAELTDDIHLPTAIARALERQRTLRERVENANEELRAATREAATALTTKMGLSLRDAGELLALSQERVRQVVS